MSFDKRLYPEFVKIHGHPFSRFNGRPRIGDEDDDPRAKGSPLLMVVHDGQGGKRSYTQAELKEGGSILRVKAGPRTANPANEKREMTSSGKVQPITTVNELTAAYPELAAQLYNEGMAAERRKQNAQRGEDRVREQERLAELNDFSRVVEKKSAHHEKTLQLLDEAKAAGRTLDQVWDEVCDSIKAEANEWQKVLNAARNASKGFR